MEYMIALIALVIGATMGFFSGVRFGWNRREQIAKQFVMNYMAQIAEDAKNNTVMIEVSRVGDMFLVHNQETGEFLAQGADHKEISKALSDRFPHKTFMATPNNLKDTGYDLHDTI